MEFILSEQKGMFLCEKLTSTRLAPLLPTYTLHGGALAFQSSLFLMVLLIANILQSLTGAFLSLFIQML